jgi:hypothetical protein
MDAESGTQTWMENIQKVPLLFQHERIATGDGREPPDIRGSELRMDSGSGHFARDSGH